MPGIVAIMSAGDSKDNKRDLELMTEAMMHEPFYTKVTYWNEQIGIYVGAVAHRGSFSDCMPVYNETKDVVLMFSGENFADRSAIENLKTRGHECGLTNASYLVYLYEEMGEEWLRQLNGWFCGVLIDLRKKRVTLFNDRYGMHRVYYHEGRDGLLCASEAKALLRVRPDLRKIDLEGLGEFVSCDCVLENRSLFSGVSLVPGGSAWTWQRPKAVKKRQYFSMREWESQAVLERATFHGRLKETVLKILPRYCRPGEPMTLSLSGGLDTRMIVAGLNPMPGQLPCHTFGGAKDILDIQIARQVARACQQAHYIKRLDQTFLEDFPKLAERTVYITDGYLDICNAHDLFFNKWVKEIAPTRLTGKFGGEVIRGHSTFNSVSIDKRLCDPDLGRHAEKALKTHAEIKRGHKLSVTNSREIPWSGYGKLAMEQSQVTLRSPYMDNELMELMYQAPASVRASNEMQGLIIEECNEELSRIITDRGCFAENRFIPSKLMELYYYMLFKVDYIYLFALPHWLVRLETILEPMVGAVECLGGQKYECYRKWFRKELATFVQDIVLDKQTLDRGYWKRTFVERMVRDHIRGVGNYRNEINRVITVELTHRLIIDR